MFITFGVLSVVFYGFSLYSILCAMPSDDDDAPCSYRNSLLWSWILIQPRWQLLLFVACSRLKTAAAAAPAFSLSRILQKKPFGEGTIQYRHSAPSIFRVKLVWITLIAERFWHWDDNGLIKTIPKIPHLTYYLSFKSVFLNCGLGWT